MALGSPKASNSCHVAYLIARRIIEFVDKVSGRDVFRPGDLLWVPDAMVKVLATDARDMAPDLARNLGAVSILCTDAHVARSHSRRQLALADRYPLGGGCCSPVSRLWRRPAGGLWGSGTWRPR